jgi:hypothetical protein
LEKERSERSVRRRTIRRRRRREGSVIGLKKTGSGPYLGWILFCCATLGFKKVKDNRW